MKSELESATEIIKILQEELHIANATERNGPGVSDIHIQEQKPRKWSRKSVNHAMKDKRVVECSQKSTVITNNSCEPQWNNR